MMKDIVEFLLRAKRATYAGKGAESTPSRPQSHDLEYIEQDLMYIDTYLGGEKFAGEEALWRNGAPIWSMNYCGRVVAEGFDGDFLKEALSHVKSDNPYRGPSEYKKENFTYKATIQGEFEWFNGFEEVYVGSTKVYECVFHGGSVK